MNRRTEACRNFQRGSCQFGDRCRYLHVYQQQPRPNPYGFGSKSSSQLSQNSQQPKPNPFGFGFQDTTQLSGVNNFGARNGNPSKPFENKWIKPAAATNSASSQQGDTQKQATVHECTDPESCKRIIVEDFKSEAPLWKLTCYGHWKYLPCDIVGDLSYEELRASAYVDAKSGIPLQSIIERERNLLNAKVTEFSALIRNPYLKRSPGPTVVNQLSVNSNTSTVSPLSNMPPTFSSFSQLGMSASVAPVMSFGNQLSGTPSNTVFGQPSFPKNSNQLPGGSKKTVTASGIFDGQLQLQQVGNLSGPSNSSFANGFMAIGSEQSSLHSSPPLLFTSSTNQSSGSLDGLKVGQSTVIQTDAGDNQNIGSDDTIWSKEWDIGEIPEEEPPERVCFNVDFQTLIR